MKEGINLAPSYPSKNTSLAKISAFSPNSKSLVRLSMGLALVLILILVLNFILNLLLVRITSQKSSLGRRLRGLDHQEKIILSVVKSQSDLEYINGQRHDFLSLINTFKSNLPEDTVLTELNLNAERVETSARTPTGLSFAQFLSSLQNTKICHELRLTRSVFIERQSFFDYSLECLLKTSAAK